MAQLPHMLEIPAWANGPDGSGNGGWSAGLLAAHVANVPPGHAIGVNLRVPPPIGRPLRAAGSGDGSIHLYDDDAEGEAAPVLVATAEPTPAMAIVPEAVTHIDVEAARAARAGFPFRDRHPFPHCIACGTERGDDAPALCLHCGPVEDVAVTADNGASCPVFADAWVPAADIADPDAPELVRVEACWSALDCPSAAPVADPDAANPSVLARLEVQLHGRARVGEEHLVAAWLLSVDGRKRWTASTLMTDDGDVLGVARALWIEVRGR